MWKENRKDLAKIANQQEDASKVINTMIQTMQNGHHNRKATSEIETEERTQRILTLMSIEAKMIVIRMSINEILEETIPKDERITRFS